MRRPHPLLFVLLLTLLLSAGLAARASAQLHFTRVATGLVEPTVLTTAPGDPRLFVTERPGTIRIVDGGVVGATAFLDLSTGVASTGGEQGLFGLAFAPDYATSRRFYVHYTREPDGASVVARYLRDASDPDLADASSGEVLLVVPQPAQNHNGGDLAFGPDGMLYVALGDGGDAAQAQDVTTPLGALLRMDVSGASGYAVPGDNPDLGPGSDPLIWAYGLRNPYRISFDRGTGDLFIGDVGQSASEEVNHQLAASPGGENYGWSVLEGSLCYDPPTGCSAAGTVLPAMEFFHSGGTHAVIGGYRYRGAMATLQGTYVFADMLLPFYTGQEGPAGVFQSAPIGSVTDVGSFGRITSFGEDADGEIHVLDYPDGEIYRLVGRDLDGDGLLDEADNCPGVANPDQTDADGNGIGDVCESPCSNGLDDAGDGHVDHPDDPGCMGPDYFAEDPDCDDDVDNDGDGRVDWDGGLQGAPADGQCTAGHRNLESNEPSRCGLGVELGVVLPALAALGRLRRRRQRIRHQSRLPKTD